MAHQVDPAGTKLIPEAGVW